MDFNEYRKLSQVERNNLETTTTDAEELATLEELKQQFETEMKNEIEAFKTDNEKVDQIVTSVNLENPETVDAVKTEIGLDGKLKEMDNEAEKLLNKQEEGEDLLELELKKEIDPMLKILCPEGENVSKYSERVKDELFEDVQKINLTKGIIYQNPEESVNSIKELLNSRIFHAINDSKKLNTEVSVEAHMSLDADFIKRGLAALMISGKKIPGSFNDHGFLGNIKYSSFYLIKDYLLEEIANNNTDGIKRILSNLHKSFDETYFQSYLYQCLPMPDGFNYGRDILEKTLVGEMPYNVFRESKHMFEKSDILKKLLPVEHYTRSTIAKLSYKGSLCNRSEQDFQTDEEKAALRKVQELAASFNDYYRISTLLAEMEPNEVQSVADFIRDFEKNNFRNYYRSNENELFSLFDPSDFDELVTQKGCSWFDFPPETVGQLFDSRVDVKDYFRNLWKKNLFGDSHGFYAHYDSYQSQRQLPYVFSVFSVNDLEELVSSGVEINSEYLKQEDIVEILNLEEENGRLKETVMTSLKNSLIRTLSFQKEYIPHISRQNKNLIETGKFPEEILNNPASKQEAVNALKRMFEQNTNENFHSSTSQIIDILQSIPLKEGQLDSEEMQNLAEKYLLRDVVSSSYNAASFDGALSRVKSVEVYISLSPEFINTTCKEFLLKIISQGFYDYENILDNFNISTDIVYSNEIQDAARSEVTKQFPQRSVAEIKKLISAFGIPDEFINSSEFQLIIQEEIKNSLLSTNLSRVQELLGAFPVSKEFLETPEVEVFAKEGLVTAIKMTDTAAVRQILERFNISEDYLTSSEITTLIQQKILELLKSNTSVTAKELMQKLPVSSEFLTSFKFQSLAQDAVVHLISRSHWDMAKECIESFKVLPEFIDSENMQDAVQKEMITNMLKNGYNGANTQRDEMVNIFNLSQEQQEKMKKSVETIESYFNQVPVSVDTKKLYCLNILNIEQSEWGHYLEKVDREKKQHALNIETASKFEESLKSYSPEIRKKVESFSKQFGEKGKKLISLAVVAYGIDNQEKFVEKINNIEKILNFYNPNTIPKGAQTSIGIEYEVVNSMAKDYSLKSFNSYQQDMAAISGLANIGKGSDAVWEIATRPTINPYILIAEIKLLQDAGMIDFNFKTYQNAARGFHMSLGGESGLRSSSKNMNFLQNMVTLSGYAGLLIGNEVSSVKGIHSKSLESAGIDVNGERVEFKGMGGDSFEQFEKTIITSHNIAIASQLEDQYREKGKLSTVQEVKIVEVFQKLKEQAEACIEHHNRSFLEAEFTGGYVNDQGEYVEVDNLSGGETITGRIEKYFGERKTDLFKEQEKYFISQDIFEPLTSNTVNAVTRANNLFIFKEDTLSKDFFIGKKVKNELMGNAPVLLATMKDKKGNDIDGKPQDSLVDRGGAMRNGYYAIQGVSQEMITHKLQIIMNDFNQSMQELLYNPTKEMLTSVKNLQYETI